MRKDLSPIDMNDCLLRIDWRWAQVGAGWQPARRLNNLPHRAAAGWVWEISKMERRHFISGVLAATQKELQTGGTGSTSYTMDVAIERKQSGKPHRGKVLAAIQPHRDDIPIFAGGTLLKLIDEGYTGVLITMSNDSMAGVGSSIGDIVLKNENDTREEARRLGLKDAFFLNYPNHNMDAWPVPEIRGRLIFLFRLLKCDTVLGYDPAALYEENPDHYVTARAVESACWMAGSPWAYPENFKAGLAPRRPRGKNYFWREPQLVNRGVELCPYH